MCNETGIPEFLEFQIPGIPMVAIVTSRTRSLRDPTNKILSTRAPYPYISVTRVQVLKNPPEYTMRNRVQSGRNTKNDRHAHLLGIA